MKGHGEERCRLAPPPVFRHEFGAINRDIQHPGPPQGQGGADLRGVPGLYGLPPGHQEAGRFCVRCRMVREENLLPQSVSTSARERVQSAGVAIMVPLAVGDFRGGHLSNQTAGRMNM